MLVPGSWLREYVWFDVPYKEVGHALTMVGLEVEGLYECFKSMKEGVVSCRVDKVGPVSGSPKLKLVHVFDGVRVRSVVCGAPNVKEGMFAPLVLPGTILPEGLEIQEKEIRGVVSQGMLASKRELLIGEEASGIWDLEDIGVQEAGKRLGDFFSVDDWVFEIGITPNRADCLSVVGVARELAAIYGIPLKKSIYEEGAGKGKGPSTDLMVSIEAPDLCMRYMASIIRGVRVGESPSWLKFRLLSAGIRPINNVVDCTNYCLLELGQPLHAFDLARLSGPAIRVRRANDHEVLETLDGKRRELLQDMLVIADERQPVAVAGIMGGANSEVSMDTRDVLLESAWFEPNQVRRTRKALKLNTEASYRFERGVDPEMVPVALRRCAHMIQDLCGGTIKGEVDIYPRPYEVRTVRFRPQRINALSGLDLTTQEQLDILHALGLFPRDLHDQGNEVELEVPSFRGDIQEEVDIVEEVARLKGFSEIPVDSPRGELIHGFTQDDRVDFIRRLKSVFFKQGAYEVISYSFCSRRELDALGYPAGHVVRNPVEILNPLTEDQAVMRTSLVPSLLQAVQRNLSRKNMNLRLFETGRCFFKDPSLETGVREEEHLMCVVTGRRFPEHWAWKDRAADVFDVKGMMENCLEELRIRGWRFNQAMNTPPYYRRECGAACVLHDGTRIGALGEMAPEVLESWEIDRPVYLLELHVDALIQAPKLSRAMTPLPRFPSSYRDVAIVLDVSIPFGEIASFIEGRANELLEDFFVFDVYTGKPIPKGKKSMAFRFVYRAKDHTLTEEEIVRCHDPLIQAILDEFKGEIRS